MRIFRLSRQAGGALASRKGKAFLMMIGTSVGIMLLTVVVGLSQGVEKRIEGITAFFGPRSVMVFPGGRRIRGMGGRGASASTLKPLDAQAVKAALADKAVVTAGFFARDIPVKANGQNTQTVVISADPNFPLTFDWNVASGEPLSWDDERAMRRVCILGATAAKNLFGDEDPVGRQMSINSVFFRVKGVLTRRGSSPMGHDLDDRIWIPLSTGLKRVFHKDSLRFIRLNVRNADDVAPVIVRLKSILRKRHRIGPHEDDDFHIITPGYIARRVRKMTRTTQLVGGALAVVALIVGGVVLMNILLLSLSERVPEIGLKRALGARQRDIFVEFLAESVIVSLMGMFFGVLLGLLPIFILPHFLPMIPMAVTWKTFLYATLFAFGVGLFFGVQPARRAARLDPVEALR